MQEHEREEDARNRLAYNTAAFAGAAFAGKLKEFKTYFHKDKLLSDDEKRQYKTGMDKMSAQLSGKLAQFPTKTK